MAYDFVFVISENLSSDGLYSISRDTLKKAEEICHLHRLRLDQFPIINGLLPVFFNTPILKVRSEKSQQEAQRLLEIKRAGISLNNRLPEAPLSRLTNSRQIF